jgi:hypothetical protein
LAQRISGELVELERVVTRVQEGWRRGEQAGDDFYLDSVALNLHSFYAGLERLFELVATRIDGVMPQGTNWHQLLLQQMTRTYLKINPPSPGGRGLGGGGKILLGNLLIFQTTCFTPTLPLPLQGGGNLFLR